MSKSEKQPHRTNTKRRIVILALIAAVLIPAGLWIVRTPRFGWLIDRLHGPKTLEQRLAQYGPSVRARLADGFRQSGVAYPPRKLVFVGLKDEKILQVYARGNAGGFRYVKSYPILAASGHTGPKLRDGDRQVPEGIYRVTFLNPNSVCHLSLRLDYPNEFDRAMATKDRRTKLGGDIMIHGNQWSVGCIAVGDAASEDLFVLAADTGIRNIEVVLSPVDLRRMRPNPGTDNLPDWTPRLYARISEELAKLPPPGQR